MGQQSKYVLLFITSVLWTLSSICVLRSTVRILQMMSWNFWGRKILTAENTSTIVQRNRDNPVCLDVCIIWDYSPPKTFKTSIWTWAIRSGINPPAVDLLTRSRILLQLGVQKKAEHLGVGASDYSSFLPAYRCWISPTYSEKACTAAQVRTVIELFTLKIMKVILKVILSKLLPVVCCASTVCFKGERKTYSGNPYSHSKWGALTRAL